MTTTRATLHPHPATPCPAVRSLGAQIALTASGRLELTFVLHAEPGAVVVPPPGPRRFLDRLWEHTCFEAFAAADGAPAYRELNFSPSRAWAAYAFTGPREGMSRLDWIPAPRVDVRHDDDGRLQVQAALELAPLIEPPWTRLRLALAAVIETRDGARAYFALRHPGERPDFHHRGGFVLTLS